MRPRPAVSRWFLAATLASGTAQAQSASDSAPDITAKPSAHYARAALEMLGFLGIGATWYWLDIDRNLADWDSLSLNQRFGLEAIRLDNNTFAINHLAHPVAGASYYSFSRANGLSVPLAATYTLLTSIAWEYGLEFQERTSYNDFIVTPGSGIAVGEAIHALGTYLNSSCRSSFSNSLGWVLGFPKALHQAFDADWPDCMPSAPHSLALSQIPSVAVETAIYPSTAHSPLRNSRSIHLQFDLMNFDRQAAFAESNLFFYDGQWTQLNLDLYSGAGATGARFETHAVLAGYHLGSTGAGGTLDFTAGLGLGYLYEVRDYPNWREQRSEMHLPGGYYKAGFDRGNWGLIVEGRISPDFSSSNSLPWATFRQLPGAEQRGKSVLAKQSYYYGFGWSGFVQARVNVLNIQAGGELEWSELNSLEGQDRVQELLEVDEQLADSRDAITAFLRLTLPGQLSSGTVIELAAKRIRRRSVLEDLRSYRAVNRYSLRVEIPLQ